MAEAVLMMALSPTMDEGVIAEWLVKEGQAVKTGDVLCEVETDKAAMAYESSVAGTVLKILKPAGSKAAVGDLIAVIGKAGEDWQAVAGTAAGTAQGQSGGLDSQISQIPQVPSLPEAQAATKPSASLATTAPATAAPSSAAPVTAAPVYKAERAIEATSAGGPKLRSGYPPSSPLARNKAAESGIDIRTLQGTGPKGRVVVRDVDEAVRTRGTPTRHGDEISPAPHSPTSTQVATKAGLRDERIPLSRMRTIIAERLSASYTSAPHFFVRAAVDMENLVELRTTLNAGRDRGLGLNAFIIKLVASALERHPGINATWEGDAIRYRGSADIGLAVALEGGLITPVVRSCEHLGISAIDAALVDLVPRARSGALTPQEYSEASFTISNLGSYGVEEFTAIINPPGSAILALGAMTEEAVVRNGSIVVRRIMHITLSCDHRVIDGAAAAAFLAELKALMEEPARALL